MTQWHFTTGDGQWLPFTDEQCAALTSALESGKPTVDLSEPGVPRNVDLVHMVMQFINPSGTVAYAAVSNEVSPAAPTAAADVSTPAAAAEDVQPAAKRANRSESVLRLSFLLFFASVLLSQGCVCRTRPSSCSCSCSCGGGSCSSKRR